VYVVPPEAGMLPLPQHRPEMTADEVAAMRRSLFVLNNYGTYQSGPAREQMYLHDGLDIMLPNGTPIHAVEAGVVRTVQNAGNGLMVIVEDADAPDVGWAYIHVDTVPVKVGQKVAQGTRVGRVRFTGLEHLHLSRYARPPGGAWTNFYSLVALPPEGPFPVPDSLPPLFEGPFRYFADGTDTPLTDRAEAGEGGGAEGGTVALLSGAVDVVAGLRDPGEHHHDASGFGDRVAVARLELTVSREGRPDVVLPAVDFRRTPIGRFADKGAEALQAQVVYRHYGELFPGQEWWRKPFSQYVVTQGALDVVARPLTAGDMASAWRTDARDAAGAPLFPDGDYTLTVRAWDWAGNAAERRETVRVRNTPRGEAP
jgi:hypothetical protein